MTIRLLTPRPSSWEGLSLLVEVEEIFKMGHLFAGTMGSNGIDALLEDSCLSQSLSGFA